jgi:hypothetical protein
LGGGIIDTYMFSDLKQISGGRLRHAKDIIPADAAEPRTLIPSTAKKSTFKENA